MWWFSLWCHKHPQTQELTFQMAGSARRLGPRPFPRVPRWIRPWRPRLNPRYEGQQPERKGFRVWKKTPMNQIWEGGGYHDNINDTNGLKFPKAVRFKIIKVTTFVRKLLFYSFKSAQLPWRPHKKKLSFWFIPVFINFRENLRGSLETFYGRKSVQPIITSSRFKPGTHFPSFCFLKKTHQRRQLAGFPLKDGLEAAPKRVCGTKKAFLKSLEDFWKALKKWQRTFGGYAEDDQDASCHVWTPFHF